MNEPLVQTQVIPYLRELVKGGHELTLLTFEPGDVDESEIRSTLGADGIEWLWLRYHKRPSVPATLFDVANAARFVRKLNTERKFDILHARSHIPMLMAGIARKVSRHKPKLIFDIRGFLPEEYVDAGVWSKEGAIYRNFKRVESWLMREADGFVVLTEKAREILSGWIEPRPVEVIPCCVDLEKRFSGDREKLRLEKRKELGMEGRFVVLHLGALGGLYLVEQIADLLAEARTRTASTYAMFLTQSDPLLIEPLLLERGFRRDDYFIGKVPPGQIEAWLYASDLGLSVVRASYATASRSPTKIPEYLAAGIPIIANAGVGDVDRLILDGDVGAILADFTQQSFIAALSAVENLGSVSERCRETARRDFDIKEVGGRRYIRLYEQLESH